MMLAMGVMASVAASPVTAQVIVGDSRPSVDVNWDLLDQLGPEPTLPTLLTRPPSQSLPLPLPPVKAAPLPAPRPVVSKPVPPKPVKVTAKPVVAEPKPVVKAPEPPQIPAVKAPEPQQIPAVKAPTPPPAPVVKAPAPPPAPVVKAPEPPPAPVVKAPEPPPAPVVKAPEPQKLATVAPSGGAVRKGDNLSVNFGAESSHLPDLSRAELDRIAQRLEKDEGMNLQLLAYAAGDEANASKARRLSLSRALEVRKYLMEMGVRSTRIEVRALGNKIESGHEDRVDIILVPR
ncbi:Lysophospholipase [Candidatus Terasakiella magnetica]|nr:Lysophospholipase [Candidatus Terasakiella magnetica]